MASLVTCIVTSVTWCFCTACASLCGSCLGNDKSSSIPPSITSGRKRSVLLLVLTLGMALGFQYGVAPFIIDNNQQDNSSITSTVTTYATSFVAGSWIDGCTQVDDTDMSIALQKTCAGNNGVYRVTSAATLFFVLAAIAVCCKPTANREAWPAKYVLFFFLCVGTILIPNDPIFSPIFLNIARIGGFFFVMFQQLVIVDMTYDWNDSWVEKSNAAESEQVGSGKKWLYSILIASATMFITSFIGIVLLFIYFDGCSTNNAFIIVTLIMMILIPAAQLSGEEGSLLSSSAVSLWAVYLCYTAVSKNPNPVCNPNLGETDTLGIALGLTITILSMCWTGWSWTAEDMLAKKQGEGAAAQAQGNSQADIGEDQPRDVKGVVVAAGEGEYGSAENLESGGTAPSPTNDNDDDDSATRAAKNDPKRLSNSWKLNIILAAISCWMAMALTSWGEISAEGNAANPQVGRISMWIIVSSEWIALSLYLWMLLAPRLFPNRDFS